MTKFLKNYLTPTVGIILFSATLSLYIFTLAPSVVTLFDDSLEFQLVTYQLGIAHPTGYPLYTILGKLFTFLPMGDVAWRVNLFSAVSGAAAVMLLYFLILSLARQITLAAQLGAISGALFLAISPVFWQQATLAEVYTLNAFFVVAILLLAQNPILPFLVGLSLTHHRTAVLLLPALVVYLYLTKKSLLSNYRVVGTSLLLGALPLLLYLYLPLRENIGSLDGTYQNTWDGFWRQVTASGYGTAFILGNPFEQKRDIGFYWHLLQNQFAWNGLALVGLIYLLWRKQYQSIALTGLTWLTYSTFNFFYHVEDIEVFFIPVFLIWAVWLGLGMMAWLQTIMMLFQKSKFVTHLLLALTLILFARQIFISAQTNYLPLVERNSWRIHDYGLDMIQQPLPKNSAIVGIVGEMTLWRYFQQTENQRPDVQTVAADLETERLATIEKLLAEGKSVYLTRELAGAAQRWSLSAVGPLIQINPKPITTPPSMAYSLNQPLTAQITLLGYNLSRLPHTGAGLAPLRLTLFWQATATIPVDLKLSVRLLNPAGEIVAVVDAVPVHFAYPTTAWRAGEIVSDVYDLSLPMELPASQYTPLLIGYDPSQNATEVGRIQLDAITIK